MLYRAQRAGSWEWLDVNLQIDTDGPEWTDSLYGEMTGTIAPELAAMEASDGHPVIEEWSTLIHAETDTDRRWTGIVSEAVPEGKDLKITVIEWAGYPDGLTFDGRIWGVRADPADLVRQLWTNLQSHAGGDLGVTVTGSTPVRLGSDSSDKAFAAKAAMKAAKAALDARTKPRKAKEAEIQKVSKPYATDLKTLEAARKAQADEVARLVKAKAPAGTITAAKAVLTTRQNAVKAKRTARDAALTPLKTQLASLKAAEEAAKKPYETAQAASQKADERERADGGAWRRLPADNPDAWQILRDLCTEVGMSFTTHTKRTEGKPQLELRLHYPALGSYRDDLVFQQGINIVSPLKPASTGEYASEVIVLGAGEGDAAIRQTVSTPDHRLRRNVIVDDKRITTAAKAGAVARAELAARTADLTIGEITVRDHPMCALWSWQVGDVILVQGQVPHLGRVAIKHRIKSWRLLGDDRAVLKLERST
ncbi:MULTISPECIES: hypothetical protein [unclassified Leucobacter]|uniref:hypothetical protein n=1 Tax=unclassified Leucobacter TaxID=2621730 RepID=UPI000620ECF0|nr:hypothetical protein [Leucobacter sp. Ag1]KKI18707.1 hypothetical protein XM48_10510 [Leucobacter sp. Ag1]